MPWICLTSKDVMICSFFNFKIKLKHKAKSCTLTKNRSLSMAKLRGVCAFQSPASAAKILRSQVIWKMVAWYLGEPLPFRTGDIGQDNQWLGTMYRPFSLRSKSAPYCLSSHAISLVLLSFVPSGHTSMTRKDLGKRLQTSFSCVVFNMFSKIGSDDLWVTRLRYLWLNPLSLASY